MRGPLMASLGEPKPAFSIRYCAKPFTVACRSVLLPARCFTRTISSGSHHLTSVSRVDLNAAQDVVRRSSTAKNCVRSSSLRAINAAPAYLKPSLLGCASKALGAPVLRSRSIPTTTKLDSVKHLVLSQVLVRPERYGVVASFETMPSSPCLVHASKSTAPSPTNSSLN